MAFNKIGGDLLESNLLRATDIAFQTDLLYIDVDNNRVGIKTNSPGNFALDVNGAVRVQNDLTVVGDLIVEGETTQLDTQNLEVEDNIIVLNKNNSAATDAGIMINRGDALDDAVFYWDETVDKFRLGTTPQDGSTVTDFSNVTLAKLQIGEPVADADATTKKYVDDQISSVSSSGVTGDNVELRLPDDSTFGDGAYLGLTSTTSVTQAISSISSRCAFSSIRSRPLLPTCSSNRF